MTETATTSVATPAAAAADPSRARSRGARGGRNRRAAPAEAAAPQAPRAPRPQHPVLQDLGQRFPALFGETLQPLKRGIFQDLQQALGEAFDKDGLKQALALHTRSTRYLQAVAAGQARRDLQGQVVEAMAPEHVFQALVEVFRRKKPRDGEDLQAKLRRRIAQAYVDSGLAREAYQERLQVRDAATQALLDQALADVAEQDARAEAQLRAFDASGVTVEAFADMYGLPLPAVQRALHRARQLQAAG